jgi:hypothetical protein
MQAVANGLKPHNERNERHMRIRKAITATLTAVGIMLAGVSVAPQPAAAQYGAYRVGAICNDGTQSGATGSGACSHHGG